MEKISNSDKITKNEDYWETVSYRRKNRKDSRKQKQEFLKQMQKHRQLIGFPLLRLPEDLLVEVLINIPLESVLALRCVCKSLNTYISSSKLFARSHLKRWTNRTFETKNVYIKNFPTDNLDPLLHVKSLCKEFARAALNSRQPNDCEFILEKGGIKSGGCRDGILCLFEFKKLNEELWDAVIYICNPALNEFRIITRRTGWSMNDYNTKVCFVPDDQEDYKVVLISLQISEERVNVDDVRSKVYIYSMNNCSWSEITAKIAVTNGGYQHTMKYHMDEYFRISDLVVNKESIYWMIITENITYDRIDGPRGIKCCNFLQVLDLNRESVRDVILSSDIRGRYIPKYGFDLVRYAGCFVMGSSYSNLFAVKEEGNDDIDWKSDTLYDSWIYDDEEQFLCVKFTRNGETNLGYTKPYLHEDRKNKVVYPMIKLEDRTLYCSFVVPEGIEFGKCITVDHYNPSLVSVLSSGYVQPECTVHTRTELGGCRKWRWQPPNFRIEGLIYCNSSDSTVKLQATSMPWICGNIIPFKFRSGPPLGEQGLEQAQQICYNRYFN